MVPFETVTGSHSEEKFPQGVLIFNISYIIFADSRKIGGEIDIKFENKNFLKISYF